LIAAGQGLFEEIERSFGEQLASHLGFEGPALLPRTEHIACDGAGAAGQDEKRAYDTAHHASSLLPDQIDR
jgi:hypothetical protein